MVGRNTSAFPAPALLTADELFSGGGVLPLHNLQAAAPDGYGAPEGDAEGAAKNADSAALPLPEWNPRRGPRGGRREARRARVLRRAHGRRGCGGHDDGGGRGAGCSCTNGLDSGGENDTLCR